MPYRQLTHGQRCHMEALNASGVSQTAIAERVGVSQPTVSRELCRNRDGDAPQGYCAEHADRAARTRRRKPAPRTDWSALDKALELMRERRWSPMAASVRLRHEQGERISHTTIYTHLARDALAGGRLKSLLPHRGRRRKRPGVPEKRGRIRNQVPMSERPQAADDRSETGHLEGDSVVGRHHKGGFTTVACRRTRFYWATCIPNRTKEVVRDALVRCLAPHKAQCRSLTLDNGHEFAAHEEVGRALGMGTYFARPYRSCDRGTNEHLNGILRRFFPKGTDLRKVTEADLQAAVRIINNRPLAVLGWKTPREVYYGISESLTRICT